MGFYTPFVSRKFNPFTRPGPRYLRGRAQGPATAAEEAPFSCPRCNEGFTFAGTCYRCDIPVVDVNGVVAGGAMTAPTASEDANVALFIRFAMFATSVTLLVSWLA
jgi:hypothetical protein